MSLTLRLFGSFACAIDSAPLPPLRSRKGYLLLGSLVLRGGSPIAREALIADLWPESGDSGGRENLRRTLTDLRRALGERARHVVSDRYESVRFEPDDTVFCDVIRFDALASRWEKLGDFDAATEAVSLHRGPLLEGFDAHWLAGERSIRDERCREMLESLGRRTLGSGETARALTLIHRAERLDPLNAATQRLLYEGLAASGDFSAARRAFRTFRERLHREFHQEPDAELARFVRELGDASRSEGKPVAPIAETPVAETVPDVSISGMVPRPLTALIGREADLARLRTTLRRYRLVTLAGPGGVGKTRLALHLAAELSAEETGAARRVCFVDASAAGDAGALRQALRGALSVPDKPGVDPGDGLREFLRPRNLLLVIDNVEQVAAPAAALFSDLLGACLNLAVFCTSRQPLRVPGEAVIPLNPLAVPDPIFSPPETDDELAALWFCDSVALLLARVADAAPGFAPGPHNAAAIVAICRALDGLPLALELVAARFHSLSPERIAGALETRFRLLSDGNPVLARHRTLRAALDWSYELLADDERTLLRRLGVFRGSWSVDAAAALAPELDDSLRTLSSLVDKSLVVYDAHPETPRYRFLETTRQYAIEHLAQSGDEDATRNRHAGFYLAWAQREDELAWSSYPGLLPRLPQAERENFRAALAHLTLHDPDAALWLESSLYLVGGWPPENLRDRIAELERYSHPSTPLGLRLLFYGGAMGLWHKSPDCERLLSRLLDAARECDDRDYQRFALSLLGNLEDERGNFDRTRGYLEQLLALADERTETFHIDGYRAKIAACVARAGQTARARELLTALLAEQSRRGADREACDTLLSLAEIAADCGDHAAVGDCCARGIPLATRHAPVYLSYFWRVRARAAMERNDPETARHSLDQSLEVSQRLGSLDREGWTRWDMAELAFRENRRADAEACMRECIDVFDRNREPHSVAQCLIRLAKYAIQWEEPARAATLLAAADRAFEDFEFSRSHDQKSAFDALVARARAALGDDDWSDTWERGRRLELAESVRDAPLFPA